MKILGTNSLGMLLLAVYLILVGVAAFVPAIPVIILPILAIITGVLLLLGK